MKFLNGNCGEYSQFFSRNNQVFFFLGGGENRTASDDVTQCVERCDRASECGIWIISAQIHNTSIKYLDTLFHPHLKLNWFEHHKMVVMMERETNLLKWHFFSTLHHEIQCASSIVCVCVCVFGVHIKIENDFRSVTWHHSRKKKRFAISIWKKEEVNLLY